MIIYNMCTALGCEYRVKITIKSTFQDFRKCIIFLVQDESEEKRTFIMCILKFLISKHPVLTTTKFH